MCRAMEIGVITLTDRSLSLEVEETDTIDLVKEMIRNIEGSDQNFQIIFNGKLLEEGHTLSEYSIQNESILQMAFGPLHGTRLTTPIRPPSRLTDGAPARKKIRTTVTFDRCPYCKRGAWLQVKCNTPLCESRRWSSPFTIFEDNENQSEDDINDASTPDSTHMSTCY